MLARTKAGLVLTMFIALLTLAIVEREARKEQLTNTQTQVMELLREVKTVDAMWRQEVKDKFNVAEALAAEQRKSKSWEYEATMWRVAHSEAIANHMKMVKEMIATGKEQKP